MCIVPARERPPQSHGPQTQPPPPEAPSSGPQPDAAEQAKKTLGAWWELVLKPGGAGCAGGLIFTFGVMALVHALIGSGPEPSWYNDLIALAWCGSAAAIFYAMRAAAMRARSQRPSIAQRTVERAVEAQVKRIVQKCRKLQRAAQRATGPYGDLAQQATELAEQARLIGAQVTRLREVARDVMSGLGESPALPQANSEANDPTLQHEYQAALEAQRRLEASLQRNAMQQKALQTRLERIEDLVDTARLDVSRPPAAGLTPGSGGIVEQVETELQAARRALEEVEQSET